MIDDTLALRLSPDESDPAILVMQRPSTGGKGAKRLSGFITNAGAEWDIRFEATRTP